MATAKTTKTISPIDSAEQALADARAKLADREAAVRVAEENVAELRARVGRGDESVTASDMSQAAFAVELAEGLRNAAKAEVKRCETRLAQTIAEHEPYLAEWVAEAIKADAWSWSLYGIPVNIGRPTEGAPTPSVWVWQTEPAKAGKTGELSGTVSLAILTPDGKPVATAGTSQIAVAARKLAQAAPGGDVCATAGSGAGGSLVHLAFSGVRAGSPVLTREPNELALKGVGIDLVNAVAQAGPERLESRREVGDRIFFPHRMVPVITGKTERAELVDSKQDGRTVRRTVEVAVTLSGDANVPEALSKALDGFPGTWVPFVGKVESAELVSHNTREVSHYTSWVPAVVHDVTARVVLVSRVARKI